MPRQKAQRPEVYAAGKREKVWKLEYREYFISSNGKEDSRHKSATWSRATHTKAEAQAKADKLLLELAQGPIMADGSMTLDEFWTTIYLPIRSRHWTGYTPTTVENIWKNHIRPQLGKLPLDKISKATIQLHLNALVDKGLGRVMVESVRDRLKSVLQEAEDNNFIVKNPCRKIELPPCKASKESRSLSEDEVRLLFEGATGMDRLFWRVLLLTGARIGEVLVLTRDDLQPDGLLIDETVVARGTLKAPKGNKIRLAALPDSLRVELEEWVAGHNNRLIFPSERGKLYRRNYPEIMDILTRGRALGIPDLTYRMCRTTFASLFQGDESDRTSIMGHYDAKFTLDRYRRPVMVRRQNSVEELDQRLSNRNVVSIESGKKVG